MRMEEDVKSVKKGLNFINADISFVEKGLTRMYKSVGSAQDTGR